MGLAPACCRCLIGRLSKKVKPERRRIFCVCDTFSQPLCQSGNGRPLMLLGHKAERQTVEGRRSFAPCCSTGIDIRHYDKQLLSHGS